MIMVLPSEQLYEQLYSCAVKAGLNKQWHLYQAKGRISQSLLVHGLNTLSIGLSIAELVEGLSECQKRILAVSCFMHDTGKTKPLETRTTSATRSKYPAHQGHDIVPDSELKEIAREFGITDEDSIRECVALARTIENPQTFTHLSDMLNNPPSTPKLMHIATLADELASLDEPKRHLRPDSQLQLSLNRLGLLLYTYRISVIRGVLTQLFHKAMNNLIVARGGHSISVFSNGTLFLSKSPIADPLKEEIVAELKRVIEDHLKDTSVDDLAAAAFGSMTGTVLVAPEFIIRDISTMKAFWRYVKQQTFISNPKLPPKGGGREKWISAISDRYKLQDENLVQERFKEIRATQYLTQIFKEVYNLATADKEKAKAVVVKGLSEHLTIKTKDVEELERKLQTMAQTSQAKNCIDLYDTLKTSSILKDLRRKNFIEKLSEVYMNLALEFLTKNLLKAGTSIEEISEMMVNELDEPLQSSPIERGKKVESSYLRGKKVGGVACACCSDIPAERAAEALIGDGTETFANFIKGGSILGNANKVMICPLCSFEAKLRRTQVKDPEETVYVFPQVQAGHSTSKAWARMLKDLFETAKSEGVPSLRSAQNWADIFLKGKIDESSKELLVRLRRDAENWRIKVIERFISNIYGTEKEDIEAFLANCEPQRSGVDYNSVNELATAVANDQIKPVGYLSEQIRSVLRKSTGTGNYFEAPNYVLFMLTGLRYKQKNIEESETSYFIRKMFIGLILSRLFLTSVSFSAIPLEVKRIPSPQGYLEVPRKIGLATFYSKLQVSDWVRIEQLDDVLRKCANLIRIEALLRNANAEPGKDALYSLSKEIPGRILHRYILASEHHIDPRIIESLNVWSDP